MTIKTNMDGSKIECQIGGHKYSTLKLYFESFEELGYMTEEKLYPVFVCFAACIGNNLNDAELLKALYTSCKDVFKREDLKYIRELVLNREHFTIDGKIPDNLEWEKHWQNVGFCDFRVLIFQLIKANLGNFSSLSALLPKEWTEDIKKQIKTRLSNLLTNVSQVVDTSKQKR